MHILTPLSRRIAAAALITGAAVAVALSGQAPAEAQPQQLAFGDTVITAKELDYDMAKKQYVFTGNVDLVSKSSHMTAGMMTVQMNADNEMQWAKCVGNVFLEKKDPEAGTMMTGRGKTMDYYEVEQKADLKGDVIVHQSSPRLVKPAVITGSRVDMNLKTKDNVVYRSEDAQAKVHVEPKGTETPAAEGQPKPAAAPNPEPADLIGDKIEMNSETQQYVATGKPMFIRPSSKLQSKTIRFQIDPKTNEISTAYADDDVIYDGRNAKGSVTHATGDKGVFSREEAKLTMEGHVHATVKDPDQEKPTVYQGHIFVYYTETGRTSLKGGPTAEAKVIVPQRPKPATPANPATPAGADAKKETPAGTSAPK